MTADRPSRIAAVLADAVQAHQAGRFAAARQGYDSVLALDGGHGWANYFRGLIAEHDADPQAAVHYFRRATAAAQPPVQAFVALGNAELAGGRAQVALTAFDVAIAVRPSLAAAFTGKSLALKQLDRLEEAAAAGRQALRLRRAWQPGQSEPQGQLDPSEWSEMGRINRIKLRHDAAQLRYLHRLGRLDDTAIRLAAAYDSLVQRLVGLPDDTAVIELDRSALQATDFAYNRLLYLPEAKPPADPRPW
jgi:tetratricopeptide (TPR) repeat protein